MAFVHLHNHTEYSLLDGAIKIPQLINTAKAMGMPAVAITDHGYMYGVVDAYVAGKDAGIKVIIGCEAYVAPRSLHDKDSKAGDDEPSHLVLLARTNEGYRNLMKIVSVACVDGFYYKPRVDRDLLRENSGGITALSACIAGEIPRLLYSRRYQDAKKLTLEYREIFGDNFYLEIQRHGLPEEDIINPGLIQLSMETGVKLVATNDVHYLRRQDSSFHDIMLCVQTAKRVADPNRLRFPNDDFYFKSMEEMESLFSDIPEAIRNSVRIADECDVSLSFGEYHLPVYKIPPGYNEDEYLRHICEMNLPTRYETVSQEIRERLDYELATIAGMGFSSYFLIVWDFVKFAKDNDIAVGPGRGSSAGSLVAYLLHITDIDPLQHQLLFERFLNAERISMPDIDIDFDDRRRSEVIDYVTKLYGRDRVAQITTFGTLKARSAIRDVARAMDMPLSKADRLAKLIPFATESITFLLKPEAPGPETAELQRLYNSEADVKDVLDYAMFLEGFPRHASIHAAGVVITKEPVSEYVPLARSKDEVGTVTQFPMGTLEKLGLLKMDFLGLSNLNVIKDTVALIRKGRGSAPDMMHLPKNDPKIFQMFSSGQTAGIFQFESSGMRQMLQEFKPERFEDLVLLNAAYRPGPMAMIPEIIEVKHGRSKVHYLHPMMEPILRDTYGSIVYQEQVMQLAQKMAGFSLGRADLLRRAMAKKKKDIMDQERFNFIAGCRQRDIDETTANQVYDMIAKFAEYGFPKPHSAAYAYIAYQTAYLKVYYTREFMAAKLTSEKNNSTKVAFYINECRKMGISVLQPNVNDSDVDFAPDKEYIRFGLSAIKSIGEATAQTIVDSRQKGKFGSLTDLCCRANLNKRELEGLIKAGACSDFGNRAQLLAVLEKVIKMAGQDKKKKPQETSSLDLFAYSVFPGAAPNIQKEVLPDLSDLPKRQSLELEKEYLGLYISGHPLDNYSLALKTNNIVSYMEIGSIPLGERLSVSGVVTNVRRITTKKGEPMAFVTLEDLTGSIEATVFPRVYKEYGSAIKPDAVLVCIGKNDSIVSESEEEGGEVKVEARILADCVVVPETDPDEFVVFTITKSQEPDALEKLSKLLREHKGETQVYLKLIDGSQILVAEDHWVRLTPEFKGKAEQIVGRENCSWA